MKEKQRRTLSNFKIGHVIAVDLQVLHRFPPLRLRANSAHTFSSVSAEHALSA
jgi:hypothetical protein